MDFKNRNCNISLSQNLLMWFSELLFKFIRGFNAVLRLSELIVNLRSSREALACELRDQNWYKVSNGLTA